MHVSEVTADLLAEHDALDAVMAGIDDAAWDAPTASERWSVTDQIAHLTYFDGTAALAIRDPEAFGVAAQEMWEEGMKGAEHLDQILHGEMRGLAPTARLERWRAGRAELAAAAAELADDARVAWYGPSMGSKSFLTARLMETWAHGQDIVDTVGATREPTDRLRHIAQLGVITRGWTYINRQAEPPEGEVGVVLDSPSGATWEWGPAHADNLVTGPAEDFCLVVTQRRHVADTGLEATGEAAIDWMQKAQAFAGPASDGPAAGTFR